MRWIRYEADGRTSYGILEGDDVEEARVHNRPSRHRGYRHHFEQSFAALEDRAQSGLRGRSRRVWGPVRRFHWRDGLNCM